MQAIPVKWLKHCSLNQMNNQLFRFYNIIDILKKKESLLK
jgi:hypothetical protein